MKSIFDANKNPHRIVELLGMLGDHVPEFISHYHVNRCSDHLWNERGHRWDRTAVPEAVCRLNAAT